ncbi:GPALPP motifs-containing protein 1 isoform X2 [Bombina bombina]|uniref:GPALPP motifs-containing protein 1 isoform X2 n=1 Tax=Bombina bombina TaxID=8345 RepID=UPI00235A9CC7|nr:GPALPP motifs-containing protein 1 isoform X2 [Bombina bombina]
MTVTRTKNPGSGTTGDVPIPVRKMNPNQEMKLFLQHQQRMRMMMMMAFSAQHFLQDLKSSLTLLRGPALPPDFRKIESEDEDYIGLQKPPGFEEKASESSEDEDIIGPLPADGPVKSSVAEDFERRALKMKEKLTGKDDDGPKNTIRESWMTELPPEMTSFGLGPRTFKRKTNEKSGDRSIWTDTPADREKKGKEKKEGKISSNKNEEQFPLSDRDKRLAEQVSTHNDSKRSKSLMDLHRTKLKRKAEEDKNKPQERRPFDRDQDLQVNRFDDAQKKALIRKSKELNTKFSHGNSSMFL